MMEIDDAHDTATAFPARLINDAAVAHETDALFLADFTIDAALAAAKDTVLFVRLMNDTTDVGETPTTFPAVLVNAEDVVREAVID
jgi:hypothetical protein